MISNIPTRRGFPRRVFFARRDKLLFDGVLFAPASVGEATSLPRGTTLQNWVRSGEYVQINNISPFNQPLKKRSVAGG